MAGATRTTRSGKAQATAAPIALQSNAGQPHKGSLYLDSSVGKQRLTSSAPRYSCLHHTGLANEYRGEVEPLGEHVKEAITLISRLEAIGLAKFNIPLPKCVALGKYAHFLLLLY